MQSNTNLLAEQYKFTCKAIQIYMQSNTNFRHIPLSSSNNEKCLREKFQRKFPEKIQTNIFKTFFPDNYAVYDKMWGKYVSRRGHRLQYDACVFHAGYLRLQYTGRICNADDLPLQQWLHERGSLLGCNTLPVLFLKIVVYAKCLLQRQRAY